MHYARHVALVVLLGGMALSARCAHADEPTQSLRTMVLPADWTETVLDHPAPVVTKLSDKLGTALQRITVRTIRIHGLVVPVNIVSVRSGADPEALLQTLEKIRGADFVRRRGTSVIEVASPNALVAARIFAWMGFEPTRKTTTIDMRLGLIDKHDYMRANMVFNLILKVEHHGADRGSSYVQRMVADWEFGNMLRLYLGPETERATFAFQPNSASRAIHENGTVLVTIKDPPTLYGLTYVDVTATVPTVDRFAPRPGKPRAIHVRPTEWWPCDDEIVRTQARAIIGGAKTALEKIKALQVFVHSKLRYMGAVGSRYGVKTCLAQGHGHCWDKSDVFITLCRAADIPARQLAGWVPVMNSGHVWAEVFVASKGWLAVDPTTPWVGTSHHYVPFFRTDDGIMPIVHMKLPAITTKATTTK